jgi:hypothetical protein
MVVLGYNSNTPRRELRVIITEELWSGIAQSVRGINSWDVTLVRGQEFCVRHSPLFSLSPTDSSCILSFMKPVQCSLKFQWKLSYRLFYFAPNPPFFLLSFLGVLFLHSIALFLHFSSSASFTLNTSRTCTSKYSATEQQQIISHIADYVISPVSLFVFSVSKNKEINRLISINIRIENMYE